jgi:ABC-type lipoprotein export system ATPase subunit
MGAGNTVVLGHGLSRVYQRGSEPLFALNDVDIEVRGGEFVGLMGHSGCGKTTLLNLIGLMDRPTSGSLSVLGNDVTRRGLKPDVLRRRNIGFIFQDFYLIRTLTALENVLLPTLWGRGGTPARARELLVQVGLEKRMTHRPAQLSGGEMQRVAVARALINSPKLILGDEPTGNLDTRTRDDVFGLLLSLNRDSGLTVIVATHDTSLEPGFSRIIRLEDGKVVANG